MKNMYLSEYKTSKVIFIAGPTAVGKTDFAIRTAQDIGGDIVSADSMQIYKYMDIGSAKPTIEERKAARHYLVDEIDPKLPFSVAEYVTLAKHYIEEILAKGRIPVVSGGTGLYIHSLLYDMDFGASSTNDSLRDELKEFVTEHGNEALHKLLEMEDKDAAARIHPNNVKKVIRAIESARNGSKIPSFKHTNKKTQDYIPLLICLNRDRQELYERINRRVDIMMEQGLENEIRKLAQFGLDENMISMKGIGYKELFAYMRGEYDLHEAVELIKKNSRHYAKRQLSWFRRYEDMKWYNISENAETAYLEMLSEIRNFLK